MTAPSPMLDTSYRAGRSVWLVWPALVTLCAAALWLAWSHFADLSTPVSLIGTASIPGDGDASPEPPRNAVVDVPVSVLGRHVRIDVLSEPPGARVELAGVSVGTTPLRAVPVRVGTDGRVPVVLRRPGYRDATGALRVGAGLEFGRVEIAMQPEDQP